MTRPINHPATPVLAEWVRAALRGVLITLVGMDNSNPRSLDAQMAVCDDGKICGYLIGGCLEGVFVLVVQHGLRGGKNESRRYGKASPHTDMRLPWGSGTEVFFDQSPSTGTLADVTRLLTLTGFRSSWPPRSRWKFCRRCQMARDRSLA